MPLHISSLLINAFAKRLHSTPKLCAAFLNFSLASQVNSAPFLSGAAQVGAGPLPIRAKLGYSAARLICSFLFLNITVPFLFCSKQFGAMPQLRLTQLGSC